MKLTKVVIEKIIKMCDKQIALHKNMDIENPVITLIMYGKWKDTDEFRLCKDGPIGKIVSDNFNGPGIIVVFDAVEVKQFFEKFESECIIIPNGK